jgi:hypothetical protein
VLGLVREIVEHLPRGGQVVIGSRSLPDLGLGRLRARGQLMEIDTDRLRFSLEETSAFFSLRRPQAEGALPLDMLAQLHRKTEGWVAAIWLASMALERHGTETGFVERFSGSDRAVADYLAEDVLAHQPPEIRDFLLRTSILRQLDASVCQALCPRMDCAAILEQLAASNLFVTRVGGNEAHDAKAAKTATAMPGATTACSPTSCARSLRASTRRHRAAAPGGLGLVRVARAAGARHRPRHRRRRPPLCADAARQLRGAVPGAGPHAHAGALVLGHSGAPAARAPLPAAHLAVGHLLHARAVGRDAPARCVGLPRQPHCRGARQRPHAGAAAAGHAGPARRGLRGGPPEPGAAAHRAGLCRQRAAQRHGPHPGRARRSARGAPHARGGAARAGQQRLQPHVHRVAGGPVRPAGRPAAPSHRAAAHGRSIRRTACRTTTATATPGPACCTRAPCTRPTSSCRPSTCSTCTCRWRATWGCPTT